MADDQKINSEHCNRRTALRLSMLVLAMFGFGFALVPLYNVFCDLTGLNGKTGRIQESAIAPTAQTSRLITVEFMTMVNSRLPWEFKPVVQRMQVHPGKLYTADFFARNLSDQATVGQAVPSISPGIAARYFNKTECFCFSQQGFEAGEQRQMPVRFVVDPGLPPEIRTLTLSYTFFDTTDRS